MDPPSTLPEVSAVIQQQLKVIQSSLNHLETIGWNLGELKGQLAQLKSALDRGLFEK